MNKSRIRHAVAGLIAGLVLLAGCGSAVSDKSGTYAPPDDPAGNIFVKDKGDVLNPDTEKRIYELNKSWESRKNKPQLLVATVTSLDGESIENKATELFDKYKPGDKGKDTGLLYLLSVNDHEDRLEVGYGLEPVIPDAAAADIIDAGHADYKNSDWNAGVNKVIDGVERVIKDGSSKKYLEERRRKEESRVAVVLIAFLVLGFAALYYIYGLIIMPLYCLITGTFSGSSSSGGWSSSGSSSGGSSGGGSSFGGGSSGGGGASGSW